jgi:hypothetical protein
VDRPRQNRIPAGDNDCSLIRRLSKLITHAPPTAITIPSATFGRPLDERLGDCADLIRTLIPKRVLSIAID